ncbi:hypothetical protein FACS189432_01850 [Bacteroidia bacterium]|nr:hypothetical protein FACS189432_01850 [Bacteroidia bacterium]
MYLQTNFNFKKMNKCKFLAMAAIAATVTMTSCSNDDEAVNNSDRVEVKFSTGNIANVQTRAYDQTWENGDSIGIYMVKETPGTLAAENILENAANIRYDPAAGGTGAVAFNAHSTTTTIYYPVSGNVKFIAYYPYRASLTDYKLPINLSNQSNQSAIDVLYAPAGTAYSKTSPNAALTFEHKLVKLVFNISNGLGVTSSLTNLTVAIGNQQTTGELNLVDGVIIPSAAGTTAINALVSNGGATAEAIVLPGTHNGTFTFTNAAGEAFTATIPDATFERGKKYTYTVTLTKATAVITGSIAAWNTGGGSVTAQ